MALHSTNPTNDAPLRDCPEAPPEEIAEAPTAADAAFDGWRQRAFLA